MTRFDILFVNLHSYTLRLWISVTMKYASSMFFSNLLVYILSVLPLAHPISLGTLHYCKLKETGIANLCYPESLRTKEMGLYANSQRLQNVAFWKGSSQASNQLSFPMTKETWAIEFWGETKFSELFHKLKVSKSADPIILCSLEMSMKVLNCCKVRQGCRPH